MVKRKIFFLTFVIFHFTLLFAQNLVQCLKTNNDLYNKEKDYQAALDEKLNVGLWALSYFDPYQEITGTNTAYGFYAPQVCGHLEPFFQVYEKGEKIMDHYNVSLTTAEANRRFKTVFINNLERLDKFIDGESVEDLKSNLDYRLMDLKMHALSTRIVNELGQGDQVESGLYLYSTADIVSFCDDKSPLLPNFQKVMNYDYRIQ